MMRSRSGGIDLRMQSASIFLLTIIAVFVTLVVTLSSGTVLEQSFFNPLVQAVIIAMMALLGYLVGHRMNKETELTDELKKLRSEIEQMKVKTARKKSSLNKLLMEHDQRFMVIKLTVLIELELQRLMKKNNLTSEKPTLKALVSELLKKKIIDVNQAEYLNVISQGRGVALHSPELNKHVAATLIDLSVNVLEDLRKL